MIKTSAAIAFYRDGKFALCKRLTGKYKGLWHFAGGKVEPGETIQDAAIRECAEEAGINVGTYDFSSICVHSREYDFECIIFIYPTPRGIDPIRMEPECHSEWKWFSPEEALALESFPGVRKTINAYLLVVN